MKSLKFVTVISASLISIGAAVSTRNNVELDIIELEAKPLESVYEAPVLTEKDLIEALIQVESRGNDSAIGDRHLVGNEAIGALQIRPIMVREVNRILKIKKSEKRFKMSDRWDREKTIEMFLIWKDFHHRDDSFETIARNWNGGPKGFKNPRTKKYWAKVQQELDI